MEHDLFSKNVHILIVFSIQCQYIMSMFQKSKKKKKTFSSLIIPTSVNNDDLNLDLYVTLS